MFEKKDKLFKTNLFLTNYRASLIRVQQSIVIISNSKDIPENNNNNLLILDYMIKKIDKLINLMEFLKKHARSKLLQIFDDMFFKDPVLNWCGEKTDLLHKGLVTLLDDLDKAYYMENSDFIFDNIDYVFWYFWLTVVACPVVFGLSGLGWMTFIPLIVGALALLTCLITGNLLCIKANSMGREKEFSAKLLFIWSDLNEVNLSNPDLSSNQQYNTLFSTRTSSSKTLCEEVDEECRLLYRNGLEFSN